MRIAVDIDGVLGDQVPHVLRRINRHLGSSFSKRDIRSWNEKLDDTDIESEIENALLEETYVLGMPVYRGARSALKSLKDWGHYLILATSRPISTHDATERWVHEKRIPHDQIMNTRESGKRGVQADILIDDNVSNVVDFARSGRLAILFLQPWNEFHRPSDQRIHRVRGWRRVCSVIEQIDREGGIQRGG